MDCQFGIGLGVVHSHMRASCLVMLSQHRLSLPELAAGFIVQRKLALACEDSKTKNARMSGSNKTGRHTATDPSRFASRKVPGIDASFLSQSKAKESKLSSFEVRDHGVYTHAHAHASD